MTGRRRESNTGLTDFYDIDARVRRTLTQQEYERVCRQLKGALEAVDFLSDRAPDLVEMFFGAQFRTHPRDTDAAPLPDEARGALEALLREVRLAHQFHGTPRPLEARASRDALRLVRGHAREGS